jgi:hypothetical protein
MTTSQLLRTSGLASFNFTKVKQFAVRFAKTKGTVYYDSDPLRLDTIIVNL